MLIREWMNERKCVVGENNSVSWIWYHVFTKQTKNNTQNTKHKQERAQAQKTNLW